MSRIDEALRRARGEVGSPSLPTAPGAGEAGTGAHDLEVEPWHFDPQEGEEARRASARPPAPLPEPHDGSPAIPRSAPGEPSLALFQGFSKVVSEKLVVTPDIAPASVEEYRKLAATLHHAQVDRGIRSVLITSAVVGEGKTLTATNLALTLSESYRRHVLLIDADLRRPSLHEVFQVPNVSGLNDGLDAGADRKLSIVQVSPRLSILTAGKPDPDPMGNLSSPRMQRVLKEATERFEWVIIDTPPVAIMTDANLLAAMVDVAVLVVLAGRTPFHALETAVQAIGREKILGVVLNRVEDSVGNGGYPYRGYYRYDYYGHHR